MESFSLRKELYWLRTLYIRPGGALSSHSLPEGDTLARLTPQFPVHSLYTCVSLTCDMKVKVHRLDGSRSRSSFCVAQGIVSPTRKGPGVRAYHSSPG